MVLTMHSVATKIDLSKSIKLACKQNQGYTIEQIAKMAALASYLRG